MNNKIITLNIKNLIGSKELISFEHRSLSDRTKTYESIRGCVIDRHTYKHVPRYFRLVFNVSMLETVRGLLDKDIQIVYGNYVCVLTLDEYYDREFIFNIGHNETNIVMEICSMNIKSFLERGSSPIIEIDGFDYEDLQIDDNFCL